MIASQMIREAIEGILGGAQRFDSLSLGCLLDAMMEMLEIQRRR